MTVTSFPKSKSADSVQTNYWLLSNPLRDDIEPIRVVHDEMDLSELLESDLEGAEMGQFIPRSVADYLDYNPSEPPSQTIICPDKQQGN